MLAFLPVMMLAFAQSGPGTVEERLEANQRANLDNLCGSYCVSRVLDLYHKKADFLTLAVELQGPKLEQQASLLQLADALRKRGVQARLVRLALLEIPSWPHPIILHINGDHFVVLESQDGEYGYIWDGHLPLKKLAWPEIKAMASDLCLLTSDEPIGEDAAYAFSGYRYAAIAIGVALAVFGVLAFRRNRRAGRRQAITKMEAVPGRK